MERIGSAVMTVRAEKSTRLPAHAPTHVSSAVQQADRTTATPELAHEVASHTAALRAGARTHAYRGEQRGIGAAPAHAEAHLPDEALADGLQAAPTALRHHPPSITLWHHHTRSRLATCVAGGCPGSWLSTHVARWYCVKTIEHQYQ